LEVDRRADPGPVNWQPWRLTLIIADMEFTARIKSDSAGLLKGAAKCRVNAQGMELIKGAQAAVQIPIGTPAINESKNIVVLPLGERTIQLIVGKFGSYQERLARDLAAFLRSEKPLPLAGDYALEPYLWVLALLPFGIMAVTGGGAIWGGLGGALVAACFAIAQLEKLPLLYRVGMMLIISIIAYSLVIWLRLQAS